MGIQKSKHTADTSKHTADTSKQRADTSKQTADNGKQTADFDFWILLLDIANRQANRCLWLLKYGCRETDLYTKKSKLNKQLNFKGNAKKPCDFEINCCDLKKNVPVLVSLVLLFKLDYKG